MIQYPTNPRQPAPNPLRTGVTVVVPVYNSARTLAELKSRLETILPAIADEYELILVDDGSKDDSWKLITALARDAEWIRGMRLMRNYGQHNAMLAGIRAAQFALTITMDDDLQHPPEEIPKLLSALTPSVDIVYGPAEAEPHGIWRAIASRLTKLALQEALGVDAARHVSSFRVFRTDLRRAFSSYQSPFLSLDVVLTWATTRCTAVPLKHQPRLDGHSQYTFSQLIRHALTLMTGFSVWPLQAASVM